MHRDVTPRAMTKTISDEQDMRTGWVSMIHLEGDMNVTITFRTISFEDISLKNINPVGKLDGKPREQKYQIFSES